jgi:antitoxin (DNA-binding transcriptional repressor) of toxin-antitoxin stability system
MYHLYILLKDEEVPVKTTIPISDARRQLPRLVKQLQRDPSVVYTITVREEAMAELRAAQASAEPGRAARTLLEIMDRLPRTRGRVRTDVASHIKKHLYGRDGVIK